VPRGGFSLRMRLRFPHLTVSNQFKPVRRLGNKQSCPIQDDPETKLVSNTK
jgi:hypothetical protein